MPPEGSNTFSLDEPLPGEQGPPDETLDDVADSLINAMPEPQQHAIDQATAEAKIEEGTQAPSNQSTDATSTEVDAAGVVWNADLHATSADGSHPKTAAGFWKKKRGAKSGSPRPSSVIGGRKSAPAAPTGPTQTEIAHAQGMAAGAAMAHTIFMMGQALGGSEWAPRKNPIDEATMMEQAWGNYFVATGRTDFPPGMALGIALCTYAAPRFTMPETRGRMSRFKLWIAAKIVKRKLKKKGINAVVTIKDGQLLVDGELYKK